MPDVQHEHPAIHHEESDVNIRALFGFAAALAVAIAMVAFMVWILFRFYDARETRKSTPEYPLAIGQGNRLPPEPRLQTNPRQDLNDLRSQEEQLLTSYGWVDKNAGVVRLPIEQAMKLTVQRGLPVRKGQQ